MGELRSISEFVQQVAEATAAVLDIDITVFDYDLCRIAGTGRYKEQIGQQITPTAAFAKALESGKTVYIFNPVVDEECHSCQKKDSCTEVANIAYPIAVNGEVVGILALIAFNEEQRIKLICQKENYNFFLMKMTELITSKLLELRAEAESDQAAKTLECIVQSFPDGVIFTNALGIILSCNPAATKILGLSEQELLGKDLKNLDTFHPLLDTLRTGQSFHDKEISWEYKYRTRRYICSTKPICHKEKVVGAIAFLKDYEEFRRMLNDIGGHSNFFNLNSILGSHALILEAKDKAKKAALSDSTILIQGESGTGKEIIARGIHGYSRRKNGPFIAINCAAIPETLLESEFFGYEGGAFTGAKSKGKPGKFELASGGTIFLDEIGDLPLSLQAKLLRVLEESKITRLGGTKATPVDVRVIAATNQNLEQLVDKKEFREDLFYRLNVIPLRLPPLRERVSDIPVLLEHFLNLFRDTTNREVRQITKEALNLLTQYSWPGNVRELKNAIEYAVNMTESSMIGTEHIPEKIRYSITEKGINLFSDNSLYPLEEVEKLLLKRGLQTLGTTEKAKGEIAHRLGISRASVYRKLKKYGLA